MTVFWIDTDSISFKQAEVRSPVDNTRLDFTAKINSNDRSFVDNQHMLLVTVSFLNPVKPRETGAASNRNWLHRTWANTLYARDDKCI